MAWHITLYSLLAVLVSRVSTLAVCPDTCANGHVSKSCSYNITFKDSSKEYQVQFCCDGDNNYVDQSVNKTFIQVTVLYRKCSRSVDFNYPLLDTSVFVIKNNSLPKFNINLNPDNLKEIDASLNKLQFVTKGIFNKFTKLKKLSLSKNVIINILEGSFNGLSVLESLDLSENKLTLLANVFTPLKNLQHLNLSRNNIEFIHENYFNNWLLQHLDVSHNNLKKVAPGALQLLPNLARLLLTDNPHLGIAQLDTQLLVGTGRRLQQIDASRTGLFKIPEAFTHSVRFLSLVGNRISSVRCGDLDSYPLLQSLDFSDNQIVSVEEDSLGRLEMLLFLNLNNNLMTSVPKSMPDELKYLSVNYNLINNLTVTDFKNLPQLRILLLNNNKIRYIADHVFDGLLSLEMLDLSSNPIQSLSPSTFDGPLSLRELRLCYLDVSVPQQDGAFPMSSPESLQMLHLQSSPSLARQLLADSAALAALSHLQYLDLRMNNLSEIRNDLLFYLGQLKSLRLHGNSFNCSAELWLKDWLSWNRSSDDNETCYYSTAEAKDEEAKYNCTFSESFTISENLPPVNLYSTEMINKLLRYYGYLSNSTERLPNRLTDKLFPNNNITERKIGKKISQNLEENNLIFLLDKYGKKNLTKIRNKDMNETSQVKISEGKVRNDPLSIEHRFLDIEPRGQSKDNKKSFYEEVTQSRARHLSGKRLNTPIDVTSNPESVDIRLTTAGLENATSERIELKTEYSRYQARSFHVWRYVGAGAVVALAVSALVLWASFRLRYRRRRPDADDQLEVPSISGGVLW